MLEAATILSLGPGILEAEVILEAAPMVGPEVVAKLVLEAATNTRSAAAKILELEVVVAPEPAGT